MNYLSKLTDIEVQYICSIIPYKQVVEYFNHHPKEFNKICPGFRATSITETKATRILIDNVRSNNFVASFVEKQINIWLAQIKAHFEGRIRDGDNDCIALLNTLPFSVFADNATIYFKLIDEIYSDEKFEILHEAIRTIKKNDSEREKSSTESKNKDTLIAKLQSESKKQAHCFGE